MCLKVVQYDYANMPHQSITSDVSGRGPDCVARNLTVSSYRRRACHAQTHSFDRVNLSRLSAYSFQPI
jgi:hypothetical protein